MLRRTLGTRAMPSLASSPFTSRMSTGLAAASAACGLILGTSVVYAHNTSTNGSDEDHSRLHHRKRAPPTREERFGTTTLYDNPGVEKLLFEHLSEEYNDLGQIEKDEVEVTVQENVFSQIGVIDTKGTRDMYFAWLGAAREHQLWKRIRHIRKVNERSHTTTTTSTTPLLAPPLPSRLVQKNGVTVVVSGDDEHALTEEGEKPHPERIDRHLFKSECAPPSLVFCDIGSGVGNVCLQVLGEVLSCPKVIGIEIIPSRHKNAKIAFENAQKYFPTFFGASPTTTPALTNKLTRRTSSISALSKSAAFYEVDLVNCAQTLKDEKVGIVFSHSWMFDDDLMKKFADVINTASKPVSCQPSQINTTASSTSANESQENHTSPSALWCVITSRPFVDTETGAPLLDTAEWELHSERQFNADWNPKSHFFMYTRKV